MHLFTLSITPNSDFLQVTEREHERMISELNAKHSEELSEMKAELRESLEAAHQAELQQLRVCYPIYPWMWLFSFLWKIRSKVKFTLL